LVSPAGGRCAGGGCPRGGALSSAILYVAIVAIWAGVLIPRWLRRDSAASERADENLVTDDAAPAAEEEPADRPRRRDETVPAAHVVPSGPMASSARGPRLTPRPAVRPEPERARAERGAPERTVAEVAEVAEPAGGRGERAWYEEHKKVLSARRRLLALLLALAIGSGALAYTRLAAWWVIVPPTLMLLGYMVLLRAASKADTEHREVERARAAAAAARPAHAPAPAAAAPVAASVTAPGAEVIDISASLVRAGQEFYDQHADAKRRAVGDLAQELSG